MKKLILCVGIFAGILTSSAQERDFIENRENWDKQLLYWGYFIGFNSNSYHIDYDRSVAITSPQGFGFNLGLIGDLRLHRNVNLRLEPSLITVSRKIKYAPMEIAGMEKNDERVTNSTYLHIPFLLKLSTNKYYNIRPYITGGIAYDYNFSSRERSSRDNSEGVFRMKRHNASYEFGIGIDIYFPHFIFSPSITGVFGINSEMRRDKADDGIGYSRWTTPIKNLKSRGFFVRFAFH